MIKSKRFLFFICTLVLTKSQAYQPRDGQIRGGVGVTQIKPIERLSQVQTYALNEMGTILQVTGDINNRDSLELNIVFDRKHYLRIDEGSKLLENVRVVVFEMGYRRWFYNNFSWSILFDSLYPFGEVEVLTDTRKTTQSWRTSARDPAHYGLYFGAGWEGDFNARIQPSLNAGYFYSLNQKSGEIADHLLLSLIFRFTP